MRTVHQQLLLVHKNNVPASGTGYRPRLLAGAVVNSHEPLGMPECAGLWGCDPSLPEPSLLTRGAAEATHVGTGGEPFCYVQALTTWLCQIFRGGEPRAPRPQGVSFPAYVHLGLHRQRPGGGPTAAQQECSRSCWVCRLAQQRTVPARCHSRGTRATP